MFLIDDLLTAPGKAVSFVFRELARKAQEEFLDDESVKRELQEIYNLLSSGKISEAEFEGRENRLLERLEQIAKLKFQGKWVADAMANVVIPSEKVTEMAAALAANESTPMVAPGHLPVVESQFDIASLTASDSHDVALSADVFEALRSLSHLISPAISDVEADERIIDSRQINIENQTDHAERTFDSAADLTSPTLMINDKGSLITDVPLQQSGLVQDPVQPLCEVVPAPIVESVPSQLPIQEQPTSAAAPPAQAIGFQVPKPIQMSDAVDIALRTLGVTRLKVSSVISAAKADAGWRVAVELVERAAVPDTGDLLGIYEVELNQTGDVTRYERTRVRRRNDLR